MARVLSLVLLLFALVVCSAPETYAQTTEFTYQGSLKDGANPATGNYDFEFLLFDAMVNGSQIGLTLSRSGVAVSNGVFGVRLDFGNQFPGANRFLEIHVRQTGGGAFTPLTPRQLVTSSPYSVQSLNAASATSAATATNATQLGGTAANQYVITTDTRMSDARNPISGSAFYIRNGTLPQASSNFSISGTGTANLFNAVTQYNINGSRVLSVAGSLNIFAGIDAGRVNTGISNSFVGDSAGFNNTTGSSNSFFGRDAGFSNTTGNYNSFAGHNAGRANTTGTSNSFFGRNAGDSNTTGTDNSFVGTDAGQANTIGFANSFFGRDAGFSNTTGSSNSFFGRDAGRANTTGTSNSFFGRNAGDSNTTGTNNSFVGTSAGDSNTTGSNNTIIGYNADVSLNNLSFATAIGAGAVANSSNMVKLGRDNGSDTVNIPGNTAVTGRIDVGGGILVEGGTQLSSSLVASGAAYFSDTVSLSFLGTGGSTGLCRNGTTQVISTCSSSLRYKTDIHSFAGGLDIVRRLRPISFDWKDGGMLDVGFGAEDVEKIEPLLVTYSNGQIEGVKYGQITTVLVNAVKEQQAQIEQQQSQIKEHQEQLKRQQAGIEALKKFICSQNPTAEICQPMSNKL